MRRSWELISTSASSTPGAPGTAPGPRARGGRGGAGRRGVDAPLRFGHGHPLDPVYAALPLQPRPDAISAVGYALGLDGDGDVLVPAEGGVLRVEDLGDPAVALGVPQEHAQQIPREQGRLLAALA